MLSFLVVLSEITALAEPIGVMWFLFMNTRCGHFGIFALPQVTAKIEHIDFLGVDVRQLVLDEVGNKCVDSSHDILSRFLPLWNLRLLLGD